MRTSGQASVLTLCSTAKNLGQAAGVCASWCLNAGESPGAHMCLKVCEYASVASGKLHCLKLLSPSPPTKSHSKLWFPFLKRCMTFSCIKWWQKQGGHVSVGPLQLALELNLVPPWGHSRKNSQVVVWKNLHQAWFPLPSLVVSTSCNTVLVGSALSYPPTFPYGTTQGMQHIIEIFKLYFLFCFYYYMISRSLSNFLFT